MLLRRSQRIIKHEKNTRNRGEMHKNMHRKMHLRTPSPVCWAGQNQRFLTPIQRLGGNSGILEKWALAHSYHLATQPAGPSTNGAPPPPPTPPWLRELKMLTSFSTVYERPGGKATKHEDDADDAGWGVTFHRRSLNATAGLWCSHRDHTQMHGPTQREGGCWNIWAVVMD